ncbi:MAG: glycoside hydrolase family 5 protein, partial [Bacteroidales bacterium]|nr:glycoside hydrolase family 5 protein [Bacteroidales bacterium]
YYDPHKFTLEDEFKEWGHSASADKKADYGDEDFLHDIFGRLKTKYIDKGIPVYIGETGCVHRDTERAEDFRKYYLEYICKAAREYGMAPFYWDNGAPGTGRECSGIINHSTGEFINNGGDIAAIMVNAITNDDPAYTLESVYNKAP